MNEIEALYTALDYAIGDVESALDELDGYPELIDYYAQLENILNQMEKQKDAYDLELDDEFEKKRREDEGDYFNDR